MCDSLFLAVVELAGSVGTRNITWSDIVGDLVEVRQESIWFTILCFEFNKRGFKEEVLSRGSSFSAMKGSGVQPVLLSFPFEPSHGRSLDQIRRKRLFGIYLSIFWNLSAQIKP
jgi:hypothetical protein